MLFQGIRKMRLAWLGVCALVCGSLQAAPVPMDPNGFTESMVTKMQPEAGAQQCPPPQSFLGHTMQEARTLMDKNFPGKWSNNGPLCSGNYFNLMTEAAGENAAPICGTPQFPVQRLILAGFDDASQVMGALYDLPGTVDLDALPAQIALALKVELKPAQRSPSSLLNRSLGKTITTSRNFLSTDGRYFVIVGQSLAPGHVMVHVYDLLAVAADQAPLETCTKEFGR